MDIENTLASRYPELAKEWHPSKNGNLTPYDVSYGSGKRVWWLGKCGHDWDAKITNRVYGNHGCPYCTGRKVLAGFNDLCTTHPELANEWHPIKNGNLHPQQVTAAIKRKVWWLGTCGHEWESNIYNRKKGHGCPYCSGLKVLSGFNDLATTNPDLAKQWHPTKNLPVAVNMVSEGSHQKAWWLCDKGHEWEAAINSRSKNHGCPYCTNQKILIGYNDLQTTHPKLAEEWHYSKNGILTPKDVGAGSTKRVWWQCTKGHEWNVKVVSRTSLKSGCPECVKSIGTSFQEQAFYYYFSKVADALNRWDDLGKEIDVYLPHLQIGIEHNCDYYHDREKDQEKVRFFREKGIRLILVYGSKIDAVFGDVIEYSHHNSNYDSLDRAIQRAFQLVGIDPPEIHVAKDEMHICASYMDLVKERSLAKHHPGLALEWHPTKNGRLVPDNITAQSNRKAWWLGKCGHEWPAAINSRVRGNGCPYCAGRKVLAGFNDLESTHPELAKEWHPTHNGTLTPQMVSYGSGKKVWWICGKNHEFKATVNSRTSKNNGCPYCSGRRVLPGFNDLATTHPYIAKQWHPTKNGSLTPQDVTHGSGKQIWWVDEDGHEWKSSVCDRTRYAGQ